MSTDAALLARAVDGDAHAFAELIAADEPGRQPDRAAGRQQDVNLVRRRGSLAGEAVGSTALC